MFIKSRDVRDVVIKVICVTKGTIYTCYLVVPGNRQISHVSRRVSFADGYVYGYK